MNLKQYSSLLKGAAALFFIFFVLKSVNINFADLFRKISNINITMGIVAILLMLFQLILSGVRWYQIGSSVSARLPLKTSIRLMFVGQFFNQVLPSSMGGDLIRSIMASKEEGVGLKNSLTAVICDRAIAALVLMAIVILSQPFFRAAFDTNKNSNVSLSITSYVLVIILFFAIWKSKNIELILNKIRMTRHLTYLLNDMNNILFLSPYKLQIIFLSVIIQFSIVGVFYLVSNGIGIKLSIISCFLIIPPVMLAAAVPISFGGWGVREGAMIYGFHLLGISAADALAVSLIFGGIQILIGMPGGFFWIFGVKQERC